MNPTNPTAAGKPNNSPSPAQPDMTQDRLADLCIEMEAGENILCTEAEETELRLRGYIRKVKPTDQVDSDIDYTISIKGKLYARYALMQREKAEASHD